MRTEKKYCKAALSLAFGWLSVPAFAAEENAGKIEELIVTAQKREESVQDVPASITALSADALENRQIRDITDLQSHVPSMAVGQLYGSNSITLRGISTSQTSGTEDPSVAVHVNGVYQARSRSLDMAMMDLERVEVLSGPQGTLYGRNATGGVVNYITKAPTSEFDGDLSIGGGDYETVAVKGTMSGPITDELGFRLSGLYDSQGEGFTENLFAAGPADDLEDRKTIGGRLAMAYKPTETLLFNLDLMYVDTHSSSLFAALNPSIDPTSVVNFVPQTLKPHETYSEVDPRLDSIVKQVAVTAVWDLTDDVQFKSITSYQRFRDQMNIDLDGIALDAVSVYQRDWSETVTQEFNLSTRSFDGRLTSIYGLFYFKDKMNVESSVHFFTDAFFPAPFHTFLFNPTYQDSKSYSAFTDQTFRLTDRVRLIAGLRFNRDEKSAVQGFCFGTSAVGCPLVSGDHKWTAWTPKFAVQYEMTDDVMLYAQYQKGFKSGGFVANTNGDDFDPEDIKGPEIGIKSMLWDQRLRLNVAAWYYTYANLQVQQVVGVGQFAVNNAAEATLKGAEVSLQASLTSHLAADVAAMVQSARYDEFTNCNQTAFPGACSTVGTTTLSDLSDNRLNRAPPYSVNVGLQYSFDLPNNAELLVRGESTWSGSVYFDEFNSTGAKQDSYSVQNAFVTYTPVNSSYTVRAFIKNLTDEDYLVSSFWNSAASQFTGNWAPPRTFGGELTLKF